MVDSPTVKVLTGFLAPEFQDEMDHMREMTKAINQQFFPDHKPNDGESVLGRVTCYTCHQGETTPKLPPGQ